MKTGEIQKRMGKASVVEPKDQVPVYLKAGIIVGLVVTVQILLLVAFGGGSAGESETKNIIYSASIDGIPKHFVGEIPEDEKESEERLRKKLRPVSAPSSTVVASVQNKLAILCILHEDHMHERRALIREYYQTTKPNEIDVVFVLGKPDRDYEKMVDAEQRHFKDLIVLDSDDKSQGKTLELFSYLSRKYGPEAIKQYDFVLKTEDDSFVLLRKMSTYLRTLKKKEVYGGVMMEITDPTYWTLFMQGRGYFLSFDLIHWIASSPFAKEHNLGYEDANVGRWITNYGLKKKDWVFAPGFIDVRNTPLTNSTVLVHPIKDPKQWIELALEAEKLGLFKY